MLAAWLHCIFSFRAYHRLHAVGPWRTAFFALYLWAVGFLVCSCFFSWKIHQNLPLFIQHFPTLTFQKGQLIAPEKTLSVALPQTDFTIRFQAPAAPPPTAEQFAEQHLLAFISGNQLYMPSAAGISSQPLPAQLDGEISAQWLSKQAPVLRTVLRGMAFFFSMLLVGFFLLGSFCLAGSVILIWSGLRRQRIAWPVLWRWAVFLQGPALVLLLINLWIRVPLFFFALFVLLNIYVQQIFNTLPEQRGNHAA